MLTGSVLTKAFFCEVFTRSSCVCSLWALWLPPPVQTHPAEVDLVTLVAFCRCDCDCINATLCCLSKHHKLPGCSRCDPKFALRMLRKAPLLSWVQDNVDWKINAWMEHPRVGVANVSFEPHYIHTKYHLI